MRILDVLPRDPGGDTEDGWEVGEEYRLEWLYYLLSANKHFAAEKKSNLTAAKTNKTPQDKNTH